MNKTIDISLAGMLFHLEEKAYYKLKKYLKSVRHSIHQTDDVDEVMNEIEARIAELLLKKQQNPQQVINEKHIDEIIAILGQPEDFEEEIDYQPGTAGNRTVKKALFRDMDHSMIAGVASGLAQYIGMDITLMRLLFIVLLFITHGSFILLYFLLWLVVPKAKTAADKLRMKGESANLDNIVDQVSAEEGTKKKVKLGETIETTGSEIGNILVKLIGFLIILITGFLLTGLIISALSFSPLSDMNMLINGNPIFQTLHLPIGLISLLLFCVIGFPVIMIFLLGFKMLFPNTNPLNKNLLIIGGTLWFISLIYLTVKSVSVLSHKNETARIITTNRQWMTAQDTLFLNVEPINTHNENYIASNDISYDFYPSKDSLVHLKIKKIAEGMTYRKAKENALDIDFKMVQDSLKNHLNFASMIRYPAKNLISTHRIKIRIGIPKGKYIKISEPISQLTQMYDCDFPALLTNKNDKIDCLKQYNNLTKEPFYLDANGNKVQIKIDDNGIRIHGKDPRNNDGATIQIDDNGIKINAKNKNKNAQIQIDDDGIKIEKNN